MTAHIWFKNRKVFYMYTSHAEACAENKADDALYDPSGAAARYHALDEQLSVDKAPDEDEVPFRIDIPPGLVEAAEMTLENLLDCQDGSTRADDPNYEFDVFQGEVVISKGDKPLGYDQAASDIFDVIAQVWMVDPDPHTTTATAMEQGVKIWDAVHSSWREGYSKRNWAINALNHLRDTDTETYKLPEWTL